ncbi:Peptide deformylase [Eumeta japonica]|uniref:peptide deformylase n=1 Tax=Eumeta variegata TaxID=151549 RepID=A0A4C1T5X9_EUMVA|nr:Peptide deformylase [Eumeta japonica]
MCSAHTCVLLSSSPRLPPPQINSGKAFLCTSDLPEFARYNEHGNPHYHLYTGWPARIAQHAFHHLDGILFTDIMDPKTLRCVCWKDVNKTKGRMLLPFSPE